MPGHGLIAGILLSPAAQKVDFRLGSVHVDGEGLRSVVTQVYLNMFTDAGVGVVSKQQKPGVAASYSTANNQFSLPTTPGFGSTAIDRYFIVHEAIHAMQDVYGGRYYSDRGSMFTTEVENEAVAYVGGALYSLYDTGVSYQGSPHDMAFMIAKSLKGRKGACVPTSQADMLKVLIAFHPIYMDDGVTMVTPTFSNGL